MDWDMAGKLAAFSCPAGGWTEPQVREVVGSLAANAQNALVRKPLGQSVLGAPIELLTIGAGPCRVLAWTQMHGDEPTHTTVLLNTLAYLVNQPNDPIAAAVLRGCTLGVVLVLNPDGAARRSRFNSWGIDLNRDAQRLATPEGRILRDLVQDFRPAVALNLHNQNHRTTIADARLPAAVALLVPPRDPQGTPTDSTRLAAQIAARFLAIVGPQCGGRVSRYDADHMPTAFGEWVQSQDVATVLIEAGGAPAFDFAWLERLHLSGLLGTLAALADGSVRSVDPGPYERLQRSSSTRLFDTLVTGGVLVNDRSAPFPADLGLSFPGLTAGGGPRRGGVVEDLGDIGHIGGVETLALPRGRLLLPGRIALAPELTPARARDRSLEPGLLAAGITTAIGLMDLESEAELEMLRGLAGAEPPGITVGFAARWPPARLGAAEAELRALRCGAVALWRQDQSVPTEVVLPGGLPLLDAEEARRLGTSSPSSPDDWIEQAQRATGLLKLLGLGRIGRGLRGDIVVAEASVDGFRLSHVLVGGRLALAPPESPLPTAAQPCGRWLLRTDSV